MGRLRLLFLNVTNLEFHFSAVFSRKWNKISYFSHKTDNFVTVRLTNVSSYDYRLTKISSYGIQFILAHPAQKYYKIEETHLKSIRENRAKPSQTNHSHSNPAFALNLFTLLHFMRLKSA